jgi:hypothetical protein
MQFTSAGAQVRRRILPLSQGIREKREDEMPVLWEWIRGTRGVGEKWEKVDQAMAFIQRADEVG